MGKKRAQLITKSAFEQAFVEAEVLMRKTLADLIQLEIKKETNPATIVGLKKAQQVVFGKTETNE
jgi:hypothetical protein